MTRARIALFVLEALPNARAARRFVADHHTDIAFVGLSNPERPSAGGLVGQVRRHLVRSGPRFLPYLAVNFGLPDILRPVAPLTQRATGTRATPEATPLRILCRRYEIPVLKMNDVNGPEIHAALRAAAPDLIVSFHFDQIIAAETLALTRLGGLNIHPALLPRHRGPVPTIHALADGDGAWGVTLHHLASTIDAGAIVAQSAVTLPAGVSATGAAVRLHELGRPLLDDALDTIARTGAVPAGNMAPVLPYCPFPSRALLRDMSRRRLRLTDAADVADALTLSARGSPPADGTDGVLPPNP